jgi:hypothetical protein
MLSYLRSSLSGPIGALHCRKFSNYPARISHCNRICGQAASDYAAGTDDGVFADFDAGAEDGAAAEPDVVGDGDGFSVLEAGAAGCGVERVGGGVDVDAGGDLHVGADGDAVAVEEDAVVVDECARADGDVVAVVAAEVGFDDDVFADIAEELAREGEACGAVGHRYRIQAFDEGLGAKVFRGEFGVAGDIKFACEHFLFLGEWGGFGHIPPASEKQIPPLRCGMTNNGCTEVYGLSPHKRSLSGAASACEDALPPRVFNARWEE